MNKKPIKFFIILSILATISINLSALQLDHSLAQQRATDAGRKGRLEAASLLLRRGACPGRRSAGQLPASGQGQPDAVVELPRLRCATHRRV